MDNIWEGKGRGFGVVRVLNKPFVDGSSTTFTKFSKQRTTDILIQYSNTITVRGDIIKIIKNIRKVLLLPFKILPNDAIDPFFNTEP